MTQTSSIRLAIANVPDGTTRDALGMMFTLLEGYNTHTHISAASNASTSYPTVVAPSMAVPDGQSSVIDI